MKKVFADTNILVDLLADRQPYSKYATTLFGMAERSEIKIFTSSHSIATAHYILKKYIDEASLRKLLFSLSDLVTIIGVDATLIRKSLLSGHKDFEDAIQIFAAESVEELNLIVTRNQKDFKNSAIIALSPDEAVKLLS
jgi:predicted nucleic acid-binding protein